MEIIYLSPSLTCSLSVCVYMCDGVHVAGHGDKIAIVDCNFPAYEVATKTTSGLHIQLANVDLPTAVDAICSLYPLDYFIDSPAQHMSPSPGNELPELAAECHNDLKQIIEKHAPGVSVEPLERFAFYEEARECFAVVQCNAILHKGVVGPDGKDLTPDSLN